MKKTTVTAKKLLALVLTLALLGTATACTNNAKSNNSSDSMANRTLSPILP